MITRHFFGLLFGYGWIIASTFFGASGYGIFLSYTAELFVLLIFYSVYRLIDFSRNSKKYAKQQSVITVWVAATPFIAAHFMGLRMVLSNTDIGDTVPVINDILYEWQTWIAVVVIGLFYLFSFISQPVERVVDLTRSRFLIGLVLLTAVNLVGLAFLNQTESPNFIYLLLSMVVIRLILEFFLNRQFKLIPNTKK